MKREELKTLLHGAIRGSINDLDPEREIKDTDVLENDLGADSLDIVDLAMKLEKELNISIPDEDIEAIKGNSVSGILDYLLPMIR